MSAVHEAMRSSTVARHTPVQRRSSAVSLVFSWACAGGTVRTSIAASGSQRRRRCRCGGHDSRIRAIYSFAHAAGQRSPPQAALPRARSRKSAGAFCGFGDHAQVGEFLDVDGLLEEANLLLQIEVALQRRDIGHAVRIAILIALA